MSTPEMLQIARHAVEVAKKKGADEVAAVAATSREVSVEWRDGRVERVSDATSRGLSLQLYVQNRYSAVGTSDLRPEAVESFIDNAIAMAKVLSKDPHRALPDPKLYQGQAQIDLQLEDPHYLELEAQARRARAQQLEEAARSAKGAEHIVSVSTGISDGQGESFRVHSNGFEGTRRTTMYGQFSSVSVKDPDGRRPEESDSASARFWSELPPAAETGRRSAERALSRIGSQKLASGECTLAIDNRAAGRLLSYLLGPMSASALQQKRSMFEGKLHTAIGSPLLDIADDPHLPKGFGSRLFDSEGMAARKMTVFEGGVLKTYFVDNYYGRKLAMAPTTAGPSNLVWKMGSKSQAELLKEIGDGLLVTGFLGGNSNGTTGDFSLGIQGFRIAGGKLVEPFAEMNLSGNHLELWKKLAAVGNDPYPYSSIKVPTLVFEGAQVAGT